MEEKNHCLLIVKPASYSLTRYLNNFKNNMLMEKHMKTEGTSIRMCCVVVHFRNNYKTYSPRNENL